MLRSPYCWRTSLVWLWSATLLAACGSTPKDLPDRAGFPGEPTSTQSPVEPAQVDDAPFDTEAGALDRELFAATRAALANGDWLAARLALPQFESRVETITDSVPRGSARVVVATPIAKPSETQTATALWLAYYRARIAHLRGDTGAYKTAMQALRTQRLPDDLRRDLLGYELDVAGWEGNSDAQLQSGLQLLSLGATDSMSKEAPPEAALTEIVWQSAQRLVHQGDAGQKGKKIPNTPDDSSARGWFDLAAANASTNALDGAAALAAWDAQYPGHSARTRASALREAALRDAQTTNLTLIVPLSGPLERAGEAVSEGFIAAFFADPQANVSIDVMDSLRFENIGDAYLDAQAKGAEVIVGPLGKRQVDEILSQTALPVPVLTLNRPESDRLSNPGALLLSLAPEDEARQLAEAAYAVGARRALLIRPAGSWGDRMETALAEHWRGLGGRIPSTALYDKPSTHSDAIRDALGLGASAQRSSAIRALFNQSIETSGRRREDLDAIFLLSKSSDEARALKPLIDYHYAGDLPVYALSTADGGGSSNAFNRDLAGLRLLAMPWRMEEDTLPGADADSNSAALHALGADAYALARRWWRMHSVAAPLYFGLTAELHAAPDGNLERRLKMAEFDRGELQSR